MSRLSRRKGGSRFGGPITSTQIDGGVGKPEEEYMSREERVFNRQLEAAIELSKKTASEESSDGSSQESMAKISRNDPAQQQVSSEKSSEGDANKSSSKSEETLDLEYQSKLSDINYQ